MSRLISVGQSDDKKSSKIMVARRFELLHLTIPECSVVSNCKHTLESGALDRSATQPELDRSNAISVNTHRFAHVIALLL